MLGASSYLIYLTESPRIIGVDPGSRASGIAIVEGHKLLVSRQIIMQKAETTETLGNELKSFYLLILHLMRDYEPTLLVVEHTNVFRNMNTTKLLTYFEAAAIMAATEYGSLVERVRTKQARKAVLGRGDLDKKGVLYEIGQRYEREFKEDEAEAVVFALYGNTILRSL